MNNKKTVTVLVICGLLLVGSVIYFLISNGIIKNVSVPDVSSVVSELTAEEEVTPVAYDGNEFIVYVYDWASEENLAGFLEDYEAQISDDSKAEYGCFVITLKETVKAENVPYLIKEMENYIMIENVTQK